MSALGLGCMGMSGLYGAADRDESIATIHAALDAGITLLDTGDFYGMGHNELLIGDALARPQPRRGPDQREVRRAARPGRELARLRRAPGGGQDRARVLAAAAAAPTTSTSTARRGSTRTVPIEETVGRDRRAGGGRLRAPRRPVRGRRGDDPPRRRGPPDRDLQIEYSLISRGIEAAILPTCRELGIAITAYGVLSRGLISGRYRADRASRPATSAAACRASRART